MSTDGSGKPGTSLVAGAHSGPPSPVPDQAPGQEAIEIASTLEDAMRALNPSWPLMYGDPRWVDLSAARSDRARRNMVRKFERKSADEHCHLAFVSHRGMGKSTELFQLRNSLGDRYTTLYLVSNTEADPVTIAREDLLLVMAQYVEQWMRSQGLPLDADLMKRIADWFADVTQIQSWLDNAKLELTAGVEAGATIPLLAKLLLGFKTLLRVESETREIVTSKLRQYPGTLLRSVNQLLGDANAKLRAAGRGELLVVIDNLERYHPKVIDDLLVKGGDQIRQLACNLIVTPPISLQYRPESGGRLGQYFDVEVMHAPRLRRHDQPYDAFDGPGRDLFEEVLRRRVNLDALVPDRAARDRLIAASGGSIRDLLRLGSEASLLPDAPPITRSDIEQVCARVRAELRDLINIHGWHEPLVAIARSKQLVSDDACLDLLHHRLVIKYNGDTWYDLHPLVAEIPEIRERLAQADRTADGAGAARPGDGGAADA